MKQYRKLGLIFAITFAVISIAIIYYSKVCGDDVCGYIVLIPLTPWWIVGYLSLPDVLANVLFYGGFVINTFIFYWIGIGLQKLFSK